MTDQQKELTARQHIDNAATAVGAFKETGDLQCLVDAITSLGCASRKMQTRLHFACKDVARLKGSSKPQGGKDF